MNKDLLIFLHIPRTGGTTFKQILRRHFPASRIKELGGDIENATERIDQLSEEEKRNLKCLIGHVPFGVHNIFPQQATYITFIRNPVDRVRSIYTSLPNFPNHPLYKEVTRKDLDLKEFLRNVMASHNLWNLQTKLISGVKESRSTCSSYNISDTNLLHLAKENLSDHFCFFGLTEKFTESLILLGKKLGWKRLYCLKRSTSPRPRHKSLNDEIVQIIRENDYLDIELYEFAKKEFERHLADYDDLNRHVRILRLQNNLYSAALKPGVKVLDFLRRNRILNSLWMRIFRSYVIVGEDNSSEKGK